MYPLPLCSFFVANGMASAFRDENIKNVSLLSLRAVLTSFAEVNESHYSLRGGRVGSPATIA
jgi:hypothetical protein